MGELEVGEWEVGEWVLFTGMVSANGSVEGHLKAILAAMVFDRDKDVPDGDEGDEDG